MHPKMAYIRFQEVWKVKKHIEPKLNTIRSEVPPIFLHVFVVIVGFQSWNPHES